MRKYHLVATHLITGRITRWDSCYFENRKKAVDYWMNEVNLSPHMALMDVLTNDQWRITQETGLQWFDESNAHLFDEQGELKTCLTSLSQ